MKRKVHIVVLDLSLAVSGFWTGLALIYTYQIPGIISALIVIAAGIVLVLIHNWFGKVTHLWQPVNVAEMFWILAIAVPF